MLEDAIISLGVYFGLGFLVLFLTILIALIGFKGKEYPFKRKRYETGNPPKGDARSKLPFQYYGFILMFLAIEPILVMFFLMPFTAKVHPLMTLTIFLVSATLFLPAIFYSFKVANEIERWR